MARNVKSTVKLNMPMVRKLTAAAKVSVAQTAEAIHTDVVQSQVIPRDTGALQNESTFVDLSDIDQGKHILCLAHHTPDGCIIIRNTTSIRRRGQMKAARNMKEMQMLKADGLMTT